MILVITKNIANLLIQLHVIQPLTRRHVATFAWQNLDVMRLQLVQIVCGTRGV